MVLHNITNLLYLLGIEDLLLEEEVDLILAGHVHGGQVRIPFLGALICPSKYGTRFSCGDINLNGNRMIVTKGLGTSIISVRFCDAPEIILLEEE